MSAGDMNQSFFQEVERPGTILVGDNQIEALPLHVLRDEGSARITSRNERSIVLTPGVFQYLRFHSCSRFRSVLQQDSVNRRQAQCARLRSRGHESPVDETNP